MSPRIRHLAAVALLSVLVVGVAAAATAGYAIDSPDATPVPERTETVQGQTLTVDSQVAADPGDQVSFDVTAPDESYRVYVYNASRSIMDSSRETGDTTVQFDLSTYAPGSYAVAVYSNAESKYVTAMPLLVRGYEIDTSAPDSVGADETFDVSIDVTATAASGDPARVSAVLADEEGTNHRVDATATDGSYVATVDAGDLPAGEYTVYGTVQNDETVEDRQELVGLDSGGSLTVSDSQATETEPTETETETTETETETTETETDGSESGSSGGAGGAGGGAGGGSGGSGAGEGSADETTTSTEDTAGDQAGADESTATNQSGNDSDGDQAGAGGSPTGDDGSGEEGGAEEAITPAAGTNGTETTGADGPGFGPLSAGLALGLLVCLLLASRVGRSSRRD